MKSNLRDHPPATTISPISHLPVELMEQIFYLSISLTPLPHERGGKHITPSCVHISHVSQRWRDIAEGFTDLWTTIHIRLGTPPEFVEYMWERCRDAPITLDVDLRRPLHPRRLSSPLTPPRLEGLAAKIRSGFHRLQSIAVQAPEYDLRTLFSGLQEEASFDKLEKLVILTDTAQVMTPWDGENLLACSAPVLRVAKLEAVQLYPDTLILKSSQLSHVDVMVTPDDSNVNLLMTLEGCHKNVQSLQLIVAGRHAVFLPPVARNALSFPRLRNLSWMSSDWSISLALLTHIQLNPAVLAKFTLCCSVAPPAATQHIWAALKTSAFGRGPAFAPEYISFQPSGSARQDNLIKMLACKYRGGDFTTATTLDIPDQLAVSIVTQGTGLFTRSSQYRDVWSFDGLKTFEAGTKDFTDRLWKRIRASVTLDRLEVNGDHLTHENFFSAFLAGLGQWDNKVPFPTLENLIIRNSSSGNGVYTWRRRRPFEFGSYESSGDHDGEHEFALDIAWLLEARRVKGNRWVFTKEEKEATGERIKLLQFHGFRSNLFDKVRRQLEKEACRVIWNGQ